MISTLCAEKACGAAADDGADGLLPAGSAAEFESRIRRLLKSACWDCHGAETQESDFRLDRRAFAMRGGNSGEPAIRPGDPEGSYLIRLIRGDEPERRMPPGEPLPEEHIELLTKWIRDGAHWPETAPPGTTADDLPESSHWAFQPVTRPAIPEFPPGSTWSQWIENPIDAFVAARLHEQGLQPNPAADRRTLFRRLSLDVLGLPPDPDAVDKFANSAAPDDVPTLIDAFLGSRHYGERWARHWLDIVRFAETHGFETNRERPNAWRYRDYVIDSLNQDKPWGQFIREQLAGDQFGQEVGLSFLVGGPYDQVKSPDRSLTLMQRQNELDDMINTTGTAFLGLTLGCARCHNHKFDPITQADYYSLQAVFAGVQHGETTLGPAPGQREVIAETELRLRQVDSRLSKWFRSPVTFADNTDEFPPQSVKYVRFTILATTGAEPCLDELSVFAGKQNVGLAAAGAEATASGTLPGYPIHQLPHINDGKFGNEFSWISNTAGGGWVMIELPTLAKVDRIEWARDRTGRYRDRLPTEYQIEGSPDGANWFSLSDSSNRLPMAAGDSGAVQEYLPDGLSEGERQEAIKLWNEQRRLQRRLADLKAGVKAYAGIYKQPGPTHRLYRGDPMAPRETVTPGIPQVFGSLDLAIDSSESERRRQLADWVADPENPLASRVIVNRVWQFHFGRPLVATPNDFGRAGVLPTHPELLDWLATELNEHGGSLKHIHRLILNSSTYRQSSAPREDGLRQDAGAEYYWRYPTRRLEAEPIRDSILAVTGSLDPTAGGPGFSAFEVEKENVRHYHPKQDYGPSDWRRMIYMTKVRMEQDSVFGLFDCPDAASPVPKRSASTTPLQALNLFNSRFTLQQAELFAARLTQEYPDSRTKRIRRAYQLCYARSPDREELTACEQFTDDFGLRSLARVLLNSNEFLFIP